MNDPTTIAVSVGLLAGLIPLWWLGRRRGKRHLATLKQAIAVSLAELRKTAPGIPDGDYSLVTVQRWFGNWTVRLEIGPDTMIVMKFEGSGNSRFRFVGADVLGTTARHR